MIGTSVRRGVRILDPGGRVSAIRVAGAGGLGLVAMAMAVALRVPEIGRAMIVALAGGIAGALVVIRRRRRRGPLSAVDTDPHHHTLV